MRYKIVSMPIYPTVTNPTVYDPMVQKVTQQLSDIKTSLEALKKLADPVLAPLITYLEHQFDQNLAQITRLQVELRQDVDVSAQTPPSHEKPTHYSLKKKWTHLWTYSQGTLSGIPSREQSDPKHLYNALKYHNVSLATALLDKSGQGSTPPAGYPPLVHYALTKTEDSDILNRIIRLRSGKDRDEKSAFKVAITRNNIAGLKCLISHYGHNISSEHIKLAYRLQNFEALALLITRQNVCSSDDVEHFDPLAGLSKPYTWIRGNQLIELKGFENTLAQTCRMLDSLLHAASTTPRIKEAHGLKKTSPARIPTPADYLKFITIFNPPTFDTTYGNSADLPKLIPLLRTFSAADFATHAEKIRSSTQTSYWYIQAGAALFLVWPTLDTNQKKLLTLATHLGISFTRLHEYPYHRPEAIPTWKTALLAECREKLEKRFPGIEL